MKSCKILFLLFAIGLSGLTSCIEETLPTEFVLDEQIETSDSALDGMVNSIYTTMAGYENSDHHRNRGV